jgi:phage regulator Rha-like protein
MSTSSAGVPAVESISLSIASLRGQRVILDADLAALYGVETRRLNEQIKRNLDRFPADFMFRLTAEEFDSLRSQLATLKTGRGQHRKYLPYAFTEHGAIMAAMVLASPRAVEVSVYVVRTFVRLREAALQHKDLAKRLDALEEKTEALAMQHDAFSRNTRANSCGRCSRRCAKSAADAFRCRCCRTWRAPWPWALTSCWARRPRPAASAARLLFWLATWSRSARYPSPGRSW